jgi:hypothetical protein
MTITDGFANTILSGEVNLGFLPWGQSDNTRDSAAGIGMRRDQFGGPPGSCGAQFVMANGSIRFLRQDTELQSGIGSSRPTGWPSQFTSPVTGS